MPYAAGPPAASGLIRSVPEDFEVEEILGWEPEGEGGQVLVHLRKRGINTDWLAGELARFAGVPAKQVGYAGLKDRNAVATQWFSVPVSGRSEPDWQRLESPELRVLQTCRHSRKLRRGDLQGNRFRLRIRRLRGDRDELVQRLERVRHQGFPNYFGEQRFGRGYANLVQAGELFAGRLAGVGHHRRSLYLSAARSQLFNEVLAARIRAGTWNRALAGDLLMLGPNRGWFPVRAIDAAIEQRIECLDLHPTGPLWGSGFSALTGAARDTEQAVMEVFRVWCQGLERYGLRQDRRPLRAVAEGLSWRFPAPAILELQLQLPAGSYATAVLRELLRAGQPPVAA